MPAFLLYRRELSPPDDRRPSRISIAPETIRKNLEDAYEVLRINLARSFQRQQRNYDLRRRNWWP